MEAGHNKNKLSIGKNATTRHKSTKGTRLCFVCVVLISVLMGFYYTFTVLFSQKVNQHQLPIVLLYHGHPEGATYEWNTGVWPAWGERN